MGVERAAVRAGNHMTVVAEEVQALSGVQHRFIAGITFNPFGAAGHGSEYVIRIHAA